MADLIDRQAAIDRFEPWLKVKGYNEGELNMLKAVLYELKCLPSAQTERKTGRWKIRETAYEDVEAKCSCCGFETLVNQPGNGLHMVNDLHFCPNCGAEMRGGDNG